MGWDAFTSRYGVLLGCSALYVLILIGAKIVTIFTSLFTLLPLVEWAAIFLFYPIVLLGLLDIGYAAARGRRADVSMLFGPFNRYWPVVGTSALVTIGVWIATVVPVLLIVLLGTVSMATSSGGPALGVGILAASFIALLSVYLLLVPRIMFAPMICLDTEIRKSGVTDSIRIAWLMTRRKGVRPRLIVILILGWALAVVCALLFVLPLLFIAMPLGITVYGAAYWQISREYWTAREYRCRVCDYDLRESRLDRCPECGSVVSEDQLRYTGLVEPADGSAAPPTG